MSEVRNAMNNKKGQIQSGINQLIFLAVGLVVVGVIVAFGSSFVYDNQQTFVPNTAGCNATARTSCGFAYNVSETSLSAMGDVSEGQGTVTTVGILAVVIGLLLGVVALFGFMRGRER